MLISVHFYNIMYFLCIVSTFQSSFLSRYDHWLETCLSWLHCHMSPVATTTTSSLIYSPQNLHAALSPPRAIASGNREMRWSQGSFSALQQPAYVWSLRKGVNQREKNSNVKFYGPLAALSSPKEQWWRSLDNNSTCTMDITDVWMMHALVNALMRREYTYRVVPEWWILRTVYMSLCHC